jgi:2,3-bisphosphoglycerate-independent phosphoglycerate mutase
MRDLIILLDGATDDPIPDLDGLTPLQAARKPFIDGIASRGEMGHTDSRAYTHLYLLEFLSGKRVEIPRGVIEAFGLGLPMGKGRVAYRLTPAIIGEGKVEWFYKLSCHDEMMLQRAVVRTKHLLKEMEPAIIFYQGGKGVMTVNADAVLELPKPPCPARVLPEDLGPFGSFIEAVADEMHGMTVLPWGGGKSDAVEQFSDLAPKARGLHLISKSPSGLGVAAFLGMRGQRVGDYREAVKVAKAALKKNDVLLHFEETDDISHRRAPREKVELIENIDKELQKASVELDKCRVSIVIDHGASSLTGNHMMMQVPYAVALPGPPSFGRCYCEDGGAVVPLSDLLEHLTSWRD